MPTPLIPYTPAAYLVDGIVPAREISLLSGASGVGKTTLLLQLIAAIHAGESEWLGHPITYPMRIAYIAADRSWASYVELAQRVGVDLSQMQVRSLVDDDTIDVNRLERDSMELLFSLIGSFDHPDLVVVDPLVVFLGVDTNHYQKVAPRLIRMARWCRQNRFTLLGTHHASKARTDYSFKRAQDRINGSGALLGFTSSQLFLAGADEIGKAYSEFVSVPHNRPAEIVRLGRDSRGLFEKWEEGSNHQTLAGLVLGVLSVAPRTKLQIQTLTKIDPATLEDLLIHLTASRAVQQISKGLIRLVQPPAEATPQQH